MTVSNEILDALIGYNYDKESDTYTFLVRVKSNKKAFVKYIFKKRTDDKWSSSSESYPFPSGATPLNFKMCGWTSSNEGYNPKDAREKFKELCGARDGIASFVEKSYIQTKNILNKN